MLPKTMRIACLACCGAVAFALFAGQAAPQAARIKRLYVEPFTVKTGPQKLHEDVVRELRKLNSVSLVADASSADATLTGNAEIWIKGYRSLNPRSGTSPSNGTPLYTGFLSVELKDAKGEVLWSYLATPGAPSEDVSKDLSRRIAKQLSKVLEP
jgi:hypothetical protein